MADVWANSMACHPRATYHIALGEFTVMIPVPHATLQGVIIPSAILKIVFRHTLFFSFFLNAVWALTSGGFRIVSDTLVLSLLLPFNEENKESHLLQQS